MLGETGPNGKQHFPAYRTGCYYNRSESCCWICYVRLLWQLCQPRSEGSNTVLEASSIVGTTLTVPTLNRLPETDDVEYEEGEITEIINVKNGDTTIITVELTTGERVAVGVQALS